MSKISKPPVTRGEKMAMATKRGYDTGKPSKGSAGPSKPKIKPSGSLKKPGLKVTWKF